MLRLASHMFPGLRVVLEKPRDSGLRSPHRPCGPLRMTPESSRASGLQGSGTLPILLAWLSVTCWV
jgi:hypothetical protein